MGAKELTFSYIAWWSKLLSSPSLTHKQVVILEEESGATYYHTCFVVVLGLLVIVSPQRPGSAGRSKWGASRVRKYVSQQCSL